jgi:hypothetical protein
MTARQRATVIWVILMVLVAVGVRVATKLHPEWVRSDRVEDLFRGRP